MNWPVSRLADATSLISSGATPLGGAENYATSGEVMLIRSQNVHMGHLVLDDVAYVSKAIANAIARTYLKRGDVLLNITGASIGRVAAFDLDVVANVNQHVCVIRPDATKLDHRYLARFLASPEQQLRIAEYQHGGTRQALTFSQIAAFTISLPPLAEQRRIADILDKADAIRRKRKEAIKLTEKLLRSAFLEMFGDPATNPKKWKVKELGELLSDIQSGWSPVCLPRPASTTEWGILKLGAITTGQYIETENKALPSDVEAVPDLEIRAGDVLFSRKNTYEHVAACVYVYETRPKLILPDLVFRFVLAPGAPLRPAVLWAMLSHSTQRQLIQGLAGGTAGSMPNIAKSRLRTVTVPVPPAELQVRFEDIMRHCESVRRNEAIGHESQRALFSSLVDRAFRGELGAAPSPSMPTPAPTSSKKQLDLFDKKR